MAKRKQKVVPKKDDWQLLTELIGDLDACARADEMKGGGDPLSVEEIELTYELAQVKLVAHMERMRRELEK
jgi:hypothetical protein